MSGAAKTALKQGTRLAVKNVTRPYKWALLGGGAACLLVLVIVLMVAGLFGGAASQNCTSGGGMGAAYSGPTGGAPPGQPDPENIPTPQIAAIIYKTGLSMGVKGDGKIMLSGFETAITESGGGVHGTTMKNIYPFLDLDSTGVFQQRASWGSVDSRRNVGDSARRYFKAALKVGENHPGTPGSLAQAVQVSAFGSRYDTNEALAKRFISQVGGGGGGAATVTATATAGAAPTPGSVQGFGDSVMLRSKGELDKTLPGIKIDAVVGRQPGPIIDAVAAAHPSGTVVVQAGNNGPLTSADGDRLKKALGGVSAVVLVTVRLDRPWEGQTNAEVRRLAASWPQVQVADWYAAAKGHADYLVDGVHPGPAGQKVYAKTVAAAVNATSGSSPMSAGGACGGAVSTGGYVNPFKGLNYGLSRTDQGVDYIPIKPSPVVAIGDGKIITDGAGSGWPGGVFMAYKLSGGAFKGKCVYVAEHLTDMLPTGTQITAGQKIATSHPGYPWTEWGWTQGPDTPSTPYNGAADGTAMPGGKAFGRFLKSLGAKTQMDPGPGPLYAGATCQ